MKALRCLASSDEHEDIALCDQVALTRITSAPLDDGPSDEGVTVFSSDYTMLSRDYSYNHLLSTAYVLT